MCPLHRSMNCSSLSKFLFTTRVNGDLFFCFLLSCCLERLPLHQLDHSRLLKFPTQILDKDIILLKATIICIYNILVRSWGAIKKFEYTSMSIHLFNYFCSFQLHSFIDWVVYEGYNLVFFPCLSNKEFLELGKC